MSSTTWQREASPDRGRRDASPVRGRRDASPSRPMRSLVNNMDALRGFSPATVARAPATVARVVASPKKKESSNECCPPSAVEGAATDLLSTEAENRQLRLAMKEVGESAASLKLEFDRASGEVAAKVAKLTREANEAESRAQLSEARATAATARAAELGRWLSLQEAEAERKIAQLERHLKAAEQRYASSEHLLYLYRSANKQNSEIMTRITCPDSDNERRRPSTPRTPTSPASSAGSKYAASDYFDGRTSPGGRITPPSPDGSPIGSTTSSLDYSPRRSSATTNNHEEHFSL